MHPGGGGGAISVLNVAEKPPVKKSVAEILSRPSGGMRSREGRSRYNRVFEFDYAIGGGARHTLVTSVTGYLMELEFDDRFRRWHSCDPADLFHSPVRKVVPQFVPTTLMLDSGVTRPPPLLAEADLLGCMNKAGIGTDATMHDHIKKLLDRCYATKDANMRFSPTNVGEALVMGYDEMGYELWKPYLRSMMEADMKSVSMGRKSKWEVLETCLQQMKACFLDARANKVKLLDAMGTFFASKRPEADSQVV